MSWKARKKLDAVTRGGQILLPKNLAIDIESIGRWVLRIYVTVNYSAQSQIKPAAVWRGI